MHRGRDDSGAVAVLLAIVLTAVIIPVAAWGVTSYVRGGVASEYRQAADAGALAAAARIPLGDLDFVQTYAVANADTADPAVQDMLAQGGMPSQQSAASHLDQLLPPGSADDPLKVACDVALQAARDGGRFGAPYSRPFNHYGQADDPQAPSCEAHYTPDDTFLGVFGRCVDQLIDPVVSVPYSETLAQILPVLLRPGVRVELTWSVKGPLDVVVSGTNEPIEQGDIAAARRVIKSAVAVTRIDDPLPGDILPPPPTLSPSPLPTLPLPSDSPSPLSTILPTPLPTLSDPLPLPSPTLSVPILHRPLSAALLRHAVAEAAPAADITQPDLTIPLDPTLATSRTVLLNALSVLESATAPVLAPFGCSGAFAALADDFADVSAPPGGSGQSAQQALADAEEAGNIALAMNLDGSITGTDGSVDLGAVIGGLTGGPKLPLLDFVPVCVQRSGDDFAGVEVHQTLPYDEASNDPVTVNDAGVRCTARGPGAFRARLVK